MSAPPMPPGKMPPRPPGMKLMPPMPPGFKAPSAGGAPPPLPPGRMPPAPPGMPRGNAPPMPPRMPPSTPPAPAAPPAQPRYPVPPGREGGGGGNSAVGGGAAPHAYPQPPSHLQQPPQQQPPQQQHAPQPEPVQAPRYLAPPGAGGALAEMPTISASAMNAAQPHAEGHRGGYGRGGGYPPSPMHRGDDFDGGRGRFHDHHHNHNFQPGRGRFDRNDRFQRGGFRGNDRGGGYGRGFDRGFDRGYGRGGGRGFDRRPPMPQRREGHHDNPPMRDPTNTVWVGSYDVNFHSRAMLCRAFWPFGRVMEVSVFDGKGYAFVHMRRTEEAKAAVDSLLQSRELGPAIFNFSKHHDYTEEEMNLPHDPNTVEELPAEPAAAAGHGGPQPGMRRPRDGDEPDSREGGGPNAMTPLPPARRARGERDAKEPSSVLWLGNLVPFISNEKLVEIFEVFGPILNVSRIARSNMAFLTYETVEQCTMALETMRGRPIEGVMLSMNYGHEAQSSNDGPRGGGGDGGGGAPGGGGYSSVPLTADGIPVNETPTNIIYLGNLPADAEPQDVEDLFVPFEGFIFSKYVEMNNIGFGHFDSVETARVARAALLNATMKGAPIRVSFGKQNHSYTMADRRRNGEAAPGAVGGGEFNLDAMMRGPGGQLDGMSGALVAGGFGGAGVPGAGALTLPAMGGAAAGAANAAGANVYARVRPPPEVTLDSRQQSLLSSTYNSCGATGLELSPSQIQAMCLLVDNCTGESSYNTLQQAIGLYSPLRSVHVFNVVAKRMKEFADDPHKRLLVLYAVTHVLLSANTDFNRFTEAALNAYLMVLLVASEGQTSSGMDRLTSIIESLQQHSFITEKANASPDYVEEFRAQLEDVTNRAKAEQDLRTFVTRRRRRD